ncbi:hypothetical protein [Pantanalinema sp. GBBB05]|uniref:hypothetical protein n=1 Tax=Pantanalinema sp. GBBB05 TaxID=2604139 RepID=UPI001D35A137|nr:hypothetical protein [Pantanalinema sp. GBBB05]
MTLDVYQGLVCPNLRQSWQLIKAQQASHYVLRSLQGDRQYQCSIPEAHALSYFTGEYTIGQIQQFCQDQLGNVPANLVVQLIYKLIDCHVLEPSVNEPVSHPAATTDYRLKSSLHWFHHPDGYWILRNPNQVKYQMQVSDRHKTAIELLERLPLAQIVQQCQIPAAELRHLIQHLALAGMLVGIEPPKPPQRKFTPLNLLFFSLPLGNPDRWLSCHVDRLRWLWTPMFSLCLSIFLLVSLVYGIRHGQEFTTTAIALWQQRDLGLMLAFGLLSLFVISIHELGHAFTLKHFDRIVPEVGLMFMFLFPAAYTNTTDQYALTRRQRALVVGAGVICQVTIAAIGFWLWQFTYPETWLHITGYLLMIAALMTVTVNLNPLSKFDGYYLAVALSGINNLRSRSFQFYANLLQRHPIQEDSQHYWIFAVYAPFSLAYSMSVLAFLLIHVVGWTATYIPMLALVLLMLWAIYYYFPTQPRS